MKAVMLETEDFAAAVVPGGVMFAPCVEALRLKLAMEGLEPDEWRPEGKAGLKLAVVASLRSADPAAAMSLFCDAYLAAGKPEGAYACWVETSFAGGKKFGPDRPMDWKLTPPLVVVRTLSKILLGSKHWENVRYEMRQAIKDKSPEDLMAAFIAGENVSWDEKDAEDAMRAALANPAIVRP